MLIAISLAVGGLVLIRMLAVSIQFQAQPRHRTTLDGRPTTTDAMAISFIGFVVIGYILASLVTLFFGGVRDALTFFYGGVRDALLCKLLTWLSCLPLRLLAAFQGPMWQWCVRVFWHYYFLLGHSEVSQLVRAVGRLIYHDAPSEEGPPANEVWEVMAHGAGVGLYIGSSLISVFYREAWMIAIRAFAALFWMAYYAAFAGAIVRWYIPRDELVETSLLVYRKVLKPGGWYLLLGSSRIAKRVVRANEKCKALARETLVAATNAYHLIVPDSGLRSGHSNHQYKPLEGERDIRLLKLWRSTPFDGITGKLVHVDLDEAPDFEAISYTWGDPAQCRGAVIDGQWRQMRKNAYEALEGRTPRWGTRLLWLDAICINQEDSKERSVQVAIMDELYARASRVVIWLGYSESADEAFAFLLHLNSNISLYTATDEDLKRELAKGRADKRWYALIHLLEHPYWQRIWIIQEIVKGKKIHILYNGTWMNWEYFAEIICSFTDFEKGPLLHMVDFRKLGRPIPAGEMAAVANIAQLRDHIGKGDLASLGALLAVCRNAKASDPRDKVYAIRGLAKDATQGQQPDYEKSIEEVYVDTARCLLRQEDATYALHFAGIGFDSKLQLPSWVPDWSANLKGIQGYLRPPSMVRDQYYNACGRYTSTTIHMPPPSLGILPAISLAGVIVDSVAETTPLLPDVLQFRNYTDFTESASFIRAMWEWFRDAESLAARGTADPYPYAHQARHEAFWRTLLVDRIDNDAHPIADFGAFYDATIRFCDLFLQYARQPEAELDHTVRQEIEDVAPKSARFMREMGHCVGKRRFAVSSQGYMAFVPPNTVSGEKVVIFRGAVTPFLIRTRDEGKRGFQLVGECYVHGMMKGEAVGKEDSFTTLELV